VWSQNSQGILEQWPGKIGVFLIEASPKLAVVPFAPPQLAQFLAQEAPEGVHRKPRRDSFAVDSLLTAASSAAVLAGECANA